MLPGLGMTAAFDDQLISPNPPAPPRLWLLADFAATAWGLPRRPGGHQTAPTTATLPAPPAAQMRPGPGTLPRGRGYSVFARAGGLAGPRLRPGRGRAISPQFGLGHPSVNTRPQTCDISGLSSGATGSGTFATERYGTPHNQPENRCSCCGCRDRCRCGRRSGRSSHCC